MILKLLIEKALKNIETSKEDEELFYSYTRGGIDVLYEKIIEESNNPDDYIKKFIGIFNSDKQIIVKVPI